VVSSSHWKIQSGRGDELIMQQGGRRVTAMAPGEPAQKARNRGQIRFADQVRADLKLLAVQLPEEPKRFQKLERVIIDLTQRKAGRSVTVTIKERLLRPAAAPGFCVSDAACRPPSV
jgi:hypothetical protein